MAKNLEIAELTGAPPDCAASHPTGEHRPRRLRQECDTRSLAQRKQAPDAAPQCEVPLGEVMAPPVAEPAIESTGHQPQVAIGQAGAQLAEKEAPSLLQRFMAALSIALPGGGDPAAEDERIIGSGDRAHHLALVSGTAVPTPRPTRPGREPLVAPPAPKSRAECRRRCGKGGFCDPSSDLGCGGVHCGNPVIRETL